jgi:late competence protein required for DNA uptake (superfamily II DNA/RNA helicase)
LPDSIRISSAKHHQGEQQAKRQFVMKAIHKEIRFQRSFDIKIVDLSPPKVVGKTG